MRNIHPLAWVAIGAAGLYAVQKFTGFLVPRSTQLGMGQPAASRPAKR